MKDMLIKFLEWMNEINRTDPMRLETDNDDIAMMFLAEQIGYKPTDYHSDRTAQDSIPYNSGETE